MFGPSCLLCQQSIKVLAKSFYIFVLHTDFEMLCNKTSFVNMLSIVSDVLINLKQFIIIFFGAKRCNILTILCSFLFVYMCFSIVCISFLGNWIIC